MNQFLKAFQTIVRLFYALRVNKLFWSKATYTIAWYMFHSSTNFQREIQKIFGVQESSFVVVLGLVVTTWSV